MAVLWLVGSVVALTVAQQLGTIGPWWLELSRYLPYPVLLAPAVAAVFVARRLGAVWQVGAVASVVLVATVTMGLAWRVAAPTVPDGGTRLRFMTYNVKAYKAVHRAGGMQGLADEVALQHPDLLVMQDANSYAWDPRAAKSWNAPVFGLPYVYEFGQYVVASRFELRDCGTGHLDYPGESQRYVHCVVATPDGPVSLVTAHFESPRSGFNAARHEGLEGVVEWRRNYADRYLQSTELARDLVPIARPLIVAGDLNAPESSSVVRTLLAVGLRDAFSAAGVGYGYSYGQALKLGFSFLRIDHILVSPEIGVVECHAGGGEASDHRPVIAELQLPH